MASTSMRALRPSLALLKGAWGAGPRVGGAGGCGAGGGALLAELADRLAFPAASQTWQGLRCLSSGDWPPHTTLTMPSLSPTMSKGNLSKWIKAEVRGH